MRYAPFVSFGLCVCVCRLASAHNHWLDWIEKKDGIRFSKPDKLDNFYFAHAFSVNQFDWIKSDLSYNVAKITKYHIIRQLFARPLSLSLSLSYLFTHSRKLPCQSSRLQVQNPDQFVHTSKDVVRCNWQNTKRTPARWRERERECVKKARVV